MAFEGGAAIIGSGLGMGNASKTPEAMIPLLRGSVAHVRVLMDSGYFNMYT